MDRIQVSETASGLTVGNEFWEAAHQARAGGAWASLIFRNGSGQNLLRGPVSSSLRLLPADKALGHETPSFYSEAHDEQAHLSWERLADGSVAVTAEGTYRSGAGVGIPVGFRRRTEYREHGRVVVTLHVMSDCGCDGVVELRALDIPLRAGLTHAYVRFHPTQAGSADLVGGRAWLDLTRNANPTPFLSRFTPLQVACFERGVEGLEVFPSSDLAAWDQALKPDIGLGLYRLGHDAGGSSIEFSPYALTARRIRTRLQGTLTLRQTIVFPETRPHSAVRAPQAAYLTHLDATDADIERLANEGVSVLCFKHERSDDGRFWRHGAVTPYDAAGVAKLRAILEACQRSRIKFVPYVALHELHPETHAFETHARAWMHAAGRSLDAIHNWNATAPGETGALMCLRSGWLHYRKTTIDAILAALPWDGLCLEWPGPLPCCHPDHAPGMYHSDTDEVFDLLLHCRKRVGAEGLLAFAAAGDSSIIAANLADHILPKPPDD
jgi:hypothetical protein